MAAFGYVRRSRRLAALVPLALVVAPAATLAAMSSDEVIAEAAKLPQQTPGQYRTSLELLSADGPADVKEFAQELRAGKAESSESCVMPDESDAPVTPNLTVPQMVQEILADGCTFEQFAVSGEALTAVVQCPPGRDLPARVKINGRVGSDSANLLLMVEQKAADQGTFRLKMRISSERIGECA
ncbi:MAG TPA: DUF3617 family protein [Croceibacterium sp.]|nr:DUF3617 family protein [Croceibacterium sp.]